MGQVFLGSSPGGRPVAVKLVHPGLASDAEFRRRFKREVEAARQVGGFHTAPVVDADADADIPWLVTAYVPGPSLAAALAEHGPFPLESALVLGAGLAEALEAIHAVGVVHRDLKPSNVLLASDGPRVIDFGIARAVDASGVTGHAGTPGFMAPELLSEGTVAPACDVFALGAVLAHVMGVRPFGEGPSEALVYRVVHKEPSLDGLPDPIRGIVARCLAKDPAARPKPAELLEALSPAGRSDAWLPPPVQEMLTRYPAPGTRPVSATSFTGHTPFSGHTPWPGPQAVPHLPPVAFTGNRFPVVLALVGHSLLFVLGIAFGILTLMGLGSLSNSGDRVLLALVLAVLCVAAIAMIRTPVIWLVPLIRELVSPCDLEISQNGIQVRFQGRLVRYPWHGIGRVTVRRADSPSGWSLCISPGPGTGHPPPRGPRMMLCYLERKSGWIVVMPVHRIKGSRRELEGVLLRYSGPHWGGNG
jgi:hypothetical protein